MKTSTLSLAIATVAFGASTIYLAQRLKDESARSEQAALETRALTARIAELEKARAEPPLAVSGTFGAINTAPGTSVSVPLTPPAVARSESRLEAVEAAVVNGPPMPPHGEAFQKIIRAQMRAQNKQIYADLGTQLGLTSEETSKLIDLLTDQHVDGIGISRETADPNERVRLLNEARRENQAKIANLLGPEGLKQLEQYQQTIPVRQEVDTLARQLEGSDAAPLSDDQRKRLLAALIDERNQVPAPSYSRGTTSDDFKNEYVDWQEDYNARVAAQARSILDAEQYAAYALYQDWQKEMNAQMRKTVVGGGNVMFSTAVPALPVGMTGESTAVLTLSAPDENPRKEP